jgi:hypothetical protein
MKFAKNIGWFVCSSFLVALVYFYLSGDEVTIDATGDTKFRLSSGQKIVEASVVGIGVSLAILLILKMNRKK